MENNDILHAFLEEVACRKIGCQISNGKYPDL